MIIHTDQLNNKLWGIALALLLLAGLVFGLSLHSAKASDGKTENQVERLITIHDENVEKVIVSKAETVGQALEQAKIYPSKVDIVDPEQDTRLIAGAYQVNIYRAQPVQIVDGQTRLNVMTPYQTPRQIAEAAKLPLYDEDETVLDRSDDVLSSNGAGLTLTIKRATKFTLVLYGKAIEARTLKPTVGEMLEGKGVKLAKNDTVSLPLTTKITANMKVEVWRNGKQTINEEQPVAFPVQQIQDASQPIGYKLVKTPGVLGKKLVTFEVEMRNGTEVARREIQSVQTLAPQAQVEVIGSKPSFSGSFAEALARLRACESGGNYANKNNPSYRGAYQYSYSTWANYEGYYDPADAPPAVQDQAAWQTYQRRGWQPWPHCGSSLPDTYR